MEMLSPTSRFGWTNASFIRGLSLLNPRAKQALEELTPYEDYENGEKQG